MSEFFYCAECNELYDSPVVLPCSHSICKRHIDQAVRFFKCSQCKLDIRIPVEGFIQNKELARMVGNFKNKRETIKANELKQQELKSQILLSTEQIDEFLTNENNLKLYVESTVKNFTDDAQNLFDEHFKIIDIQVEIIIEMLNKSEQSLKRDTCSSEAVISFLKDKESIINSFLERLKFLDNEREWKSIKEQTDKLLNEIKIQSIELDNFIFKKSLYNDNLKVFEFSKLRINSNRKIKCEELKYGKLESNLLDDQQSKKLMDLCEFSDNNEWRLLYRASEHDFSSKEFHTNCDDIPNTLVIVKSKNGYIFGGFTNAKWNNKDVYIADESAFLFSLINKNGDPLKIKISADKSEKAIYGDSLNGPVFGLCQDLTIKGNQNEYSSSNLGFSYKHPIYLYDTIQSKSFLASSQYFYVEDYEVFEQVLDSSYWACS